MGGGVSLLALLGGTWFPIPTHGFLHDLAQFLPSYWLVQASHVALGGHAWPRDGVGRDRRLDGAAQRARGARLPARHRPGVGARARSGSAQTRPARLAAGDLAVTARRRFRH